MGTLFKLSWRNTWRNKRRTFFTLTAVLVGVMSLVFSRSYITGIVNSASDEMIKSQIGHIRIAHKEFLRLERILPKEYLVSPLKQIQEKLSRIPDLELSCPRIKFNVLLNHGYVNKPAIATGIQPLAEDKNMGLSQFIIQGSYFKQDQPGLSLIIGKNLARELKVKVEDELLMVTTDINYSTYALPFKIVGIFETGFSVMDKHMVYIPLEKAGEMLNCGDAAHEILVFLKEPAKAPQVSLTIAALLDNTGEKQEEQVGIQVIPWQKHDFIASVIPYIKKLSGSILTIFMIIVALVILNTMLMSVMERYYEIGLIKALGFKDREVVSMIALEAGFIGTIGSAAGGLFGGIISAITEKIGFDTSKMIPEHVMDKIDIPLPLFSRVLYPDFTFSILFGSIIFGIMVSLAAVLYPAFKSTKMSPVEAFRSKLKI